MSTIRIEGPFYNIHYVEIDADTADNLISGSLDRVSPAYDMDGLPSYNNFYGAIYLDCVSVDDETLFGGVQYDEWVAKQKAAGAPETDTRFTSYTCNLSDLSKEKYFYITLELYEGDEYREIDGEFDVTQLSIEKSTLFAGEEILSVYDISYNDSEVDDQTEVDGYEKFYVFHNGVLTELE